MSHVAITGVSGLVGRSLPPALLQDGHQVRGLVRTELPAGRATIPANLVRGDVRDRQAVESLLEGCEIVVHLAPGVRSGEDLVEVVVRGTENVLSAAAGAGVARVVYLSCLGADAAARSPYYAARWKAEMLVRGSPISYTVLRPSLVLGPGDGVVRALADLIRLLPVVPIPGRGQHRFQPVDVRDLARCIQMAISAPELENETVSVGGPTFLTVRQLVDLVQGQLGVLKPKLLLPPAALAAISRWLPDPAGALFRRPSLDRFEQGVVASPGIVQRTFGFEPRSVVAHLGDYLL